MSNHFVSWMHVKVEPGVLSAVAGEFFDSVIGYFEQIHSGKVRVSKEFLSHLKDVARLAEDVLKPLSPEACGDIIGKINMANLPCRVNARGQEEMLAAGFEHSDIARYETGIFKMYEPEEVSATEYGRREQRDCAIQVLRDFVEVSGIYAGFRLGFNERDNSIVRHFLSKARTHLDGMSRESLPRSNGVALRP